MHQVYEAHEGQQIPLASQQADCVNFVGPHLLVSGPPGTGKTFVLLQRAKKLAEQMTPPGSRGKVLFITFNKTLAQYAREQLHLNGVSGTVEVYNYHSWAYDVLAKAGNRPQVVLGTARQALIGKSLAASRATWQTSPGASGAPGSSGPSVAPSLLSRGLDWWEEEIDWVKGRAIGDWDTYRTVERTGRGQGLRENARRVVWEVFTRYNELLREHGHCDFRDYSLRLLALGTPLPDRWRANHVLIDEAQDFHYADLRVLTYLAHQSTTVVADRKQNIYQTGFTWRDLGFDITGGGRSRVLSQSYRTTRQIALLAASLQGHDPLVRPDDFDYGPGALPTRDGPLPVVYGVRDRAHEEATILRLLRYLTASATATDTSGSTAGSTAASRRTVGLLAYERRVLDALEALLRQHQLPCERLSDRDSSIATPGIKLTTFHSAKGLEFDDVVVVGLTHGIFPRQRPEPARPIGRVSGEHDATGDGEGVVRNHMLDNDRADGDSDEQEALHTARRVLYVAMTRAKSRLYLLQGTPPSRLLGELDPTLYHTTAPEMETQ